MGAKIKKSFLCFSILLLTLLFGLFGCGDVYKNMKISVDTTEIVLYLNGDEDEPSSKEIKATISGVKDKKVVKEVEVVFDDEKIASAGAISYSGNEVSITIYASAPGVTNMRVKSVDNSKRVFSEEIRVEVIEKVEEIDVSNVVATAIKGQSVDLLNLEGINFSPSKTGETELEFYFPNGTGSGVDLNAYGQIIDKHIFVPSQTAPNGFCPVLVKSSKLSGFNENSPLQKTFSVLVLDAFGEDDIIFSKYSKKESKFETIENELTLISNYVDKSSLPEGTPVSVEEEVMVDIKNGLSTNLKDFYKFEISYLEESQKGVAKIDLKQDDYINVFKLIPNQTGMATLKIKVSIEKDKKIYYSQTKLVNLFVKNIVTKMEITTEDQTVVYDIDEETINFASIGVFETSSYVLSEESIGGSFVEAKNLTQGVGEVSYKVLLKSKGTLSDGTEINQDAFSQYIKISDGTNFVKFGEDGIDFKNGKKFYVSYDKEMLNSDAQNLSSFSLIVVANYADGLKRLEAEIKCSVFKGVEEFGFVVDEDVITENNKEFNVEFKAKDNINLPLISQRFDESVLTLKNIAYKLEDDGITENKKVVVAIFEAKALGVTNIRFVEKYTNQAIIKDVFVVVPTKDVVLSVDNNDAAIAFSLQDGLKTNAVIVASGAKFNIDLLCVDEENNEVQDATIQNITLELVDERTIISAEKSRASVANKNILIETSFVNYTENIQDASYDNFATIIAHITFYDYDAENLVRKESVQELKLGTYKKLVDFSFGNGVRTRYEEVFDSEYLSIENAEKKGVGYIEVIPYFEKAHGSSYDYYLENLSFPEGVLQDEWKIEYIGFDENPTEPILMETFKGIKVSAKGAIGSHQEEIVVQFAIKEFNTVYAIACHIRCRAPSVQIEDVELFDEELYLEDWQSAYNAAEIKTSTSPVSVFDKGLSYIVIKETDVKDVVLVCDNSVDELIPRFGVPSDSRIGIVRVGNEIFAKCNQRPEDGASYYVVVIPSYLVNFKLADFEVSEYKQKILNVINQNLVESDQHGVCKKIAINVSGGEESLPYKIATSQDFENMLTGSKNAENKFFELTADINYSSTWGSRKFNANLISTQRHSINGITNSIFDEISKGSSVKDVVLYYDAFSVEAEVFGLLANKNSGTIENVIISPNISSSGANQISVSQLSQTGEGGSVTYSDIVVGGLVGTNNGMIVGCGGQVFLNIAPQEETSNVVVGGLVGENIGVIKARKDNGQPVISSLTSAIDVLRTIDNAVMQKSFIGGLVGKNSGIIDGLPTITNSKQELTNIRVYATINAPLCSSVGGIVGENKNIIKGVLVAPKINALNNVGGAVGVNDGENFTADLENGYSHGLTYVLTEFYNNSTDKTAIYAQENVGGLVGFDSLGDIYACYVTSYLTNTESVGVNDFLGDIYGLNNVGGFVGYAENSKIAKSYASTNLGVQTGSDVVLGGFVGRYVISNNSSSIAHSYALTQIKNLYDGAGVNLVAGFAGIVDVQASITGAIASCYAVTNGGVLTNGSETYKAFVNVLENDEIKAVEKDDDEKSDILSSCYYASIDALSESDGLCLSIKTPSEMKNLDNYEYFTSQDWKIIETANQGYPVIKITEGTVTFELYNTEIGSVKIEKYCDDPEFNVLSENSTVLPRFAVFGEDKVVVVMDMFASKIAGTEQMRFVLPLFSLLELDLTDGVKVEDYVITSQDESILRISDDSFYNCTFLRTGTVRVTISARQNMAISKTFQICVVGGFKDFGLNPQELNIPKGNAGSTIVTFEQNSKNFYGDTNVLKIEVEGQANIRVGDQSFETNSIDVDVTTNKTLLLSAFGDILSTPVSYKVTPYLTIGFFDERGIVKTEKLLLNKMAANIISPTSIQSKIEGKTFSVTVFEGVKNFEFKESGAAISNSQRFNSILSITSDAIDKIDESIQEKLNLEIKKTVYDENSGENVTKTFSTQNYVEGSNKKQVEISFADGTIKYDYGQKADGNYDYLQSIPFTYTKNSEINISFALEHEKQRMKYNEEEIWTFSYRNEDGEIKTATLTIVWLPSQIEGIVLSHFISKEDYASGGFLTMGDVESDNKIASGSPGVLKIEVTRSYADFDYLEVRGVSSADEITFTRLVETTQDGKSVLVDDLGLYSQNLAGGGIRLNNLGDGVFYVETLTKIGLVENTEFLIDVDAYKIVDGASILVRTTKNSGETKTLYSAFAPYVYLNVVEDYARTTDGGILARGSTLTISMTGVLQNSSVSLSISGNGGEIGDKLTSVTLSWDTASLYSSATTTASFESSATITAGINSFADNDDGVVTLSATVKSPGFSTSTQIKLYLVDYIVKNLVVENVSENGNYPIKIQDGYKPLKLALNTSLGLFTLNSSDLENVEELAVDAKLLDKDTKQLISVSDKPVYDNFKASYQSIAQTIIRKVKELNAKGTTAESVAAIWKYRNYNLNLASTYDYFYLKVDNRLGGNNIVVISGKEQADVVLSTTLYRGIKKSQNENIYEFILDSQNISESFLGVSSGIYDYSFVINFTNDSSYDLPTPISTEQELREMNAGGHYILTKDITLTNWVPLTTRIGSLDGNGYKLILKNFALTTTTSSGAAVSSLNAGLFASISTYDDTKLGSTQPTRLTNIVLDVSQTVVVDLDEATNVNFGFLVGENNGGVIYNCEVISGVSEKRATLELDSNTNAELLAGVTKFYDEQGNSQGTISNFSTYLDGLQGENPQHKYYKYERYVEITGVSGNRVVLENNEIVNIFNSLEAENFGIKYGKIYYIKDSQYEETNITAENFAERFASYSGGNYVQKTTYIELNQNNLKVFDYNAWNEVFKAATSNQNFGSYASGVMQQIALNKDTTFVFVKSDVNISNSIDINIGGLVGKNSGYITNSRFGRLADVITQSSKGRSGVDENINTGGEIGDGIVDNLTTEYGISLFGGGRLAGLVSQNEREGVISSCYFANSNLVNMMEVTNNSSIITGGLVAVNRGKITSSYVESSKQKIEAKTNANIPAQFGSDGATLKVSFEINGDTYYYLMKNTIEYVVHTELSEDSTIAIIDAVISGGKFVLDGVEYTLDNISYNSSSEVIGFVLNHVRRNQNKIYFSGEIGGLVHTNASIIDNSYSNIGLKSRLSTGGLVYNNSETDSVVKNSFSASALNNESVTNGPFIGVNTGHILQNSGTVENCYYLMDQAIKNNETDPASALDASNLCSNTDLLLGFDFYNQFSGENGVWNANENAFETPQLVEANNIAYSRREVTMAGDKQTYINTTFGNKDNPRIVYSKESFAQISVEETPSVQGNSYYEIKENLRIVANIDFEQQAPVVNVASDDSQTSVLSSKIRLNSASLQGNGMKFENVLITSDDAYEENNMFIGLFKTVKSSIVSNLGIGVYAFDGTMSSYAGALTGACDESYINNIVVSSNSSQVFIRGRHVVGGVVGIAYNSSKLSNIESSVSVNSTFDASSGSSVKFAVEGNAIFDQSNIGYGIMNPESVSYAGGIVGAVVASSGNSYINPTLVNCTQKGDFTLRAEIVGGIAGFVSKGTAIRNCRLILNTSETGQEIQAGTIGGGLVGENRGLVNMSYIALSQNVQQESDKSFSVNEFFEQAGTSELFTGSNNVLGGLVGLNVGTENSNPAQYSGGIRYSYSRVKVQNKNALAAGGVVGIAVANISELANLSEVARTVNTEAVRQYPKKSDNIEKSFVTTVDDVSVVRQSLFLQGVYTTGAVEAQKVAGGMVGVATALISTQDGGLVASNISLPSSVSVEEGAYAGFVVGKLNYSAIYKNENGDEFIVVFSENGAEPSNLGVSTITIDPEKNVSQKLVGSVLNSKLYKDNYYHKQIIDENGEMKEIVIYKSLFEVAKSYMPVAFVYMFEGEDSKYQVDPSFNTFVFPKLSSGVKTQTEDITSAKDYIEKVLGGETSGQYKITQNITFDFASSVNIGGKNQTISDWFKEKYGKNGPSGFINGVSQEGTSVTITIKNNNQAIPFFGGNVEDLRVTNINFVFDSNTCSSDKNNAVNTDYWGALAAYAKDCKFINVSVDFKNRVEDVEKQTTFNINNFMAVGGLVGYSQDNVFSQLTVKNLNIENNNYTILGDELDVGSITGKSDGNSSFDEIIMENNTINITTSGSIEKVNIGGATGYALGESYIFNTSTHDSRQENQSITINTQANSALCVGGIVGQCIASAGINSTSQDNLNMEITNNNQANVYVGGVVGGQFTRVVMLKAIKETNTQINANLTKAQNVYVGGLIGTTQTIISSSANGFSAKGEITNNSFDGDINVSLANETNANMSYVGGLVGQLQITTESSSSNEIADFLQKNQTSGNITVSGNADEHQNLQQAYIGGVFAYVANSSARNVVIANVASNTNIFAQNVSKTVIGGICGETHAKIDKAINYGRLRNDCSNAKLNKDSFAYIGGIVAKTTKALANCLSLGPIFEPNFVDVYDNETREYTQISFAQAIVAKDEHTGEESLLTSCYYSSAFTGINQTIGNYDEGTNRDVYQILGTLNIQEINGASQTLNGWRLPYITGLNSKTIESKNNFENLESDKSYFINPAQTIVVNSTISLSGLENISIIGFEANVQTNGCALFDEVKKGMFISGLNITSNSGIELSENNQNFGMLTKVNNGLISNCMAGTLPLRNMIQTENNVKTLSDGLASKEFGGSESETNILKITLNDGVENLSVGSLVGQNNFVIINSSCYADININTDKIIRVGSLVGENNFKVSYSLAMGKLNVNKSLHQKDSNVEGDKNSVVGEVVGSSLRGDEKHVTQLMGYVDVCYLDAPLSIGGVVGGGAENETLFYVGEMSRTPSKISGAVNYSMKAIYSENSASGLNKQFWTKTNNDEHNLYGLYYIRTQARKYSTFTSVNNGKNIFEIENYAELNMLNYQKSNMHYVFVRDLCATTKLFNDSNNTADKKYTINGNGHILFAEKLIESASSTYTAFNLILTDNCELKNIMFKFGDTTIESTNIITVAPLVKEVNGGKVTNCAVVGNVTIDGQSDGTGTFGGICHTLKGGGIVERSWSGVSVMVKNTKSFTVGGLVGNMSPGTEQQITTLTQCFVDANISLGESAVGNNQNTIVGGLVGNLSSSQSYEKINYCYVSSASIMSTETFNTQNSKVYIGEFVGTMGNVGATYSLSQVIEQSLFEGIFLDQLTSGGNNTVKIGANSINSSIGFGYINILPNTGLIYSTTLSVSVGDALGIAYMAYRNYNGLPLQHPCLSFDYIQCLDENVFVRSQVDQENFFPYLNDVTPEDRKP